MLAPGKDFDVEDEHGILRCVPKSPEAQNAFRVLQLQLQKIVPHLPEAPPVPINVDGVIGPGTTLVVQMVAGRLAEGSHPELAALACAQPEEAIPGVAAGAMELAGFLDRALEKDPTAVVAPKPPPEPPQPGPLDILKSIFTKRRLVAAGATLCGIGGLLLVARASDRRALGHVDRSAMLPYSDGSDEFDDEGDVDEIEPEPEVEVLTPAQFAREEIRLREEEDEVIGGPASG